MPGMGADNTMCARCNLRLVQFDDRWVSPGPDEVGPHGGQQTDKLPPCDPGGLPASPDSPSTPNDPPPSPGDPPGPNNQASDSATNATPWIIGSAVVALVLLAVAGVIYYGKSKKEDAQPAQHALPPRPYQADRPNIRYRPNQPNGQINRPNGRTNQPDGRTNQPNGRANPPNGRINRHNNGGNHQRPNIRRRNLR